MQLLGTYNGNLAAFQYQQLLALLQAAIGAGDLSSGSRFDKTALAQLEAQATSFANLPTATAGTRALDESMLQPLQLLQARFSALLAEATSFSTRSLNLQAYLTTETSLLDQLLAADQLQYWIAGLPQLPNSWSYGWDFSIDQGKVSVKLLPVDPSNAVEYPSELSTGSIFVYSPTTQARHLIPPGPGCHRWNAACLDRLQGEEMNQFVLKPWVSEVGLKMQSILLSGLRAPDQKTIAIKRCVRWLRGNCQVGADPSKQSYMQKIVMTRGLVEEAIDELEYTTVHYAHHFAESMRVVAIHHPDAEVRDWASQIHYEVAVKLFHFHPETNDEFLERHRDKMQKAA